jgi:hypothetical protein
MTTYYKATFSNGEVFVRSTTGRKYSHAHSPGWKAAQWASAVGLAYKAAKGAEIVPAIEISAAEYRIISQNNATRRAAVLKAHGGRRP